MLDSRTGNMVVEWGRNAQVGRISRNPVVPIPLRTAVVAAVVAGAAVDNTVAAAAAGNAAAALSNTAEPAVVAAGDSTTVDKNIADVAAAGGLCLHDFHRYCSLNVPRLDRNMATRPIRSPLEFLRLDEGSLRFVEGNIYLSRRNLRGQH